MSCPLPPPRGIIIEDQKGQSSQTMSELGGLKTMVSECTTQVEDARLFPRPIYLEPKRRCHEQKPLFEMVMLSIFFAIATGYSRRVIIFHLSCATYYCVQLYNTSPGCWSRSNSTQHTHLKTDWILRLWVWDDVWVWLGAYLLPCFLSAYIPTHLPPYLTVYLPIFLVTSLPSYISTALPTYPLTNLLYLLFSSPLFSC